MVHYASDGWLLHKSSEEARRQAEADKAAAEAAAKFAAEVERAAREKEAGMDVEAPDDSRQLRNQVGDPGRQPGWAMGLLTGWLQESVQHPWPPVQRPPGPLLQPPLQFNFGERAAQTFNYPLRDRGTMTEPPPTATASGEGGWRLSCAAWAACARLLALLPLARSSCLHKAVQ